MTADTKARLRAIAAERLQMHLDAISAGARRLADLDRRIAEVRDQDTEYADYLRDTRADLATHIDELHERALEAMSDIAFYG
jgi:DNA repair ATPase RecN